MNAKLSLVLVLMFLCTCLSYGQRYAVANGGWNGPIWATTPAGVPGSAAIPTALDDVYTNGFSVEVGGDVSCRNLFIRRDVSNGLVLQDFSFSVLTIHGFLSGANTSTPPGSQPVIINDALVMGTFETIRFEGPGEKVRAWGYACPLGNVIFSNSTASNTTISQGFRVANGGSVIIESGVLSIGTNSPVRQLRGCSDCTLTINAGATLNTLSAINGGGSANLDEPNTTFGNISIEGTLITGNYVNSNSFSMGAGGHFQTSFAGANQSEGWWYQSNRPTAGILDPASEIVFTASSAQNLYARQYGTLTLQGSGTITKTVTGSGSLNFTGDLLFSNVGITFNSSLPIVFNGNSDQTITGGGTANFNGGLQVSTTGGALILGQDISVQNGVIVNPNGSFDVNSRLLTLSGDIVNSGSLSFGTGASLGTLVISGVSNISGAVSPSFGHLTISGSLSSSGSINVAGNITNSGIFSVNGVRFNGTSSQTTTGVLDIGTLLSIANGANVSNQGTINIGPSGVVTLEPTAIFDAGSGANTLRLQSTTLSNGARIALLPVPDRFNGNVTVERFIDGPESWRYLAMPITNANVGMLQDDFAVTGDFSDRSPIGGLVVGNTAPSVFRFDPTIAPEGDWVAIGTGGTVSATPLANTRGYSVWTYLDADGERWDVTGTIGKGPIPITLAAGFNLVPNPYPSAIDWDEVNFAGANVTSNAVYVRTGDGIFASYVQGAPSSGGEGHPLGSGWTGQLATGQAFWVSAESGGTLTFEENDKVASTTFVRESLPENYVRIRLEKGDISDDVVVHFREGATLEKDVQFDAPKRINDVALNISTYNHDDPDTDYAINGVPFVGCEFVTNIKLGSTNPQGDYVLGFEDLATMRTGYEMTLVDNFLNKEKEITEGMAYAFSITPEPTSGGAGRFSVIFKSPLPPVELAVLGDVLTAEKSTGEYQWFVDGAPIAGANAPSYQVMASGIYKVSITRDGCTATSGGFEFLISGAEHRSLSGYYDIYPNPVEGYLTLKGPDLGQSRMTVFDPSGKIISVNNTLEKDVNGEWNYVGDFTKVRNGMYLLNIEKGSQVIQLKVIKR